MNKTIRAIGAGFLVGIWLALTAFAWFGPAQERSESERRDLAKMPELTWDSILDKTFMERFEDYSLDQFPLRDSFRTVKATFLYDVLQQTDNNGYFIKDGYIAKQTYPLSQPSVNHALNCFNRIYDKYLAESDCKVYLSVIPDKAYFLAQENGYPTMDYESLLAQLDERMDWATYIDITDQVTLEDYYRTDTHWKQENLLPVAQTLCGGLGVQAPGEGDFTEEKLDKPFYGVYKGQAALPMDPEQIVTLRNEILNACRVFNYETNQYSAVYDGSKLSSRDLYDIYLSGAAALLKIENPAQDNGRHLVVFRDSFGSSMVPLLVHGYESVILVDTRYMSPDILGQFVEFTNQDVLFLYSATVLNNSSALK